MPRPVTLTFVLLTILVTIVPPAAAQPMNARTLYEKGRESYGQITRSGCAASAATYVDANKYLFAYYQLVAGSMSAPDRARLDTIVNATQRKVDECLGANRESSISYRNAPPDNSSLGSSSVRSSVRRREDATAAPAEMPPFTNTTTAQDLQAQVDYLSQRTADLSRTARAIAGVWHMVSSSNPPQGGFVLVLVGNSGRLFGYAMEGGKPGLEDVVALGQGEPQPGIMNPGLPFRSIFGQDRQPRTGIVAYRFRATVDGEAAEISLDVRRLAGEGVVLSSVKAEGETRSFTGYKAGDARIPGGR